MSRTYGLRLPVPADKAGPECLEQRAAVDPFALLRAPMADARLRDPVLRGCAGRLGSAPHVAGSYGLRRITEILGSGIAAVYEPFAARCVEVDHREVESIALTAVVRPPMVRRRRHHGLKAAPIHSEGAFAQSLRFCHLRRSRLRSRPARVSRIRWTWGGLRPAGTWTAPTMMGESEPPSGSSRGGRRFISCASNDQSSREGPDRRWRSGSDRMGQE